MILFPCHKVIFLDTEHRTSTYCMRQRGHEGKCNIEDCEPLAAPVTMPAQATPTKEELLKNYGPYDKNDPRAQRGF